MNFISSERLVSRVVKQLNSYQSAGLLDEGDFYRWIKEILVTLNIPAFSEVHKIVSVEDGEALVPEDLHRLDTLWYYEECKENRKPELHLQNQVRSRIHTKECIDPCGNPCEIEEDPNILVVKYFVQDEGYRYKRFKNKEQLFVKNYKKDPCDDEVKNVIMNNGKFHFNFDEGTVYIKYQTILLDDDGLPMIPDEVKIEQAIEDYIVYRFFQESYYNNYFDALQRMQYSEQKYLLSFGKALSFTKLPTVQSMLEVAKRLRNRYTRLEI